MRLEKTTLITAIIILLFMGILIIVGFGFIGLIGGDILLFALIVVHNILAERR